MTWVSSTSMVILRSYVPFILCPVICPRTISTIPSFDSVFSLYRVRVAEYVDTLFGQIGQEMIEL